MIDSLLLAGVSNSLFALGLALVAKAVGADAKRSQLAHLLWILVLVKLLTPPFVTVPVGASLDQPAEITVRDTSPASRPDATAAQVGSAPRLSWPPLKTAYELSRPLTERTKTWLVFLWLLGSSIVVARSLWRVRRFERLLHATGKPASGDPEAVAKSLATQLNLKVCPDILVTSARVSPMVWWTGGKIRVVMPASLLEQLDASQWRWILAHELSHIRRGDHLVRWLEWFAAVCFWWNPLVWWAQRNLRAAEEVCCDAHVLSDLNPDSRYYANALLSAVESLVCPAIRPRVMASEMNSGGVFENRMKIILSNPSKRRSSLVSRACVLFAAVFVLPFGIGLAQKSKSEPGKPSVTFMQQLGKRAGTGDKSAVDEIAEIYLDSSDGRLDLMRAAFGEVGDAIDDGNGSSDPAFQALLYAVGKPETYAYAVEAFGPASARGHEPSLEVLLNYDRHGIMHSCAVLALLESANKGNQRAIDFLVAVINDDSDRSLWSAASEGLDTAASQGNVEAKAALEKVAEYEELQAEELRRRREARSRNRRRADRG